MASGIQRSIGAAVAGISVAGLAYGQKMDGRKEIEKACESIGLKAINMALQWLIKETNKGPIPIAKETKESHNPISGDIAKKTLETIGEGSALIGAVKALKKVSDERS